MIKNADKIKQIMNMTSSNIVSNNPNTSSDNYYEADYDYEMNDGYDIPSTEQIFAQKYGTTTKTDQSPLNQKPQITNEKLKNSRLPKEILESFKNNQIESSNNNVFNNTNDLDLTKLFGDNMVKSKNLINENNTQVKLTDNPNNQISNTTIDYSIIKAIIKQEISEKFDELFQKLDDGEITVMKLDSKISLIDRKKRLYQGKLEAKGQVGD